MVLVMWADSSCSCSNYIIIHCVEVKAFGMRPATCYLFSENLTNHWPPLFENRVRCARRKIKILHIIFMVQVHTNWHNRKSKRVSRRSRFWSPFICHYYFYIEKRNFLFSTHFEAFAVAVVTLMVWDVVVIAADAICSRVIKRCFSYLLASFGCLLVCVRACVVSFNFLIFFSHNIQWDSCFLLLFLDFWSILVFRGMDQW